jgi:hypothetical protein
MKKVLKGLEPTLWFATLILFVNWVISFNPEFFNREVTFVSGWWWFSTLLLAVFITEYNSN